MPYLKKKVQTKDISRTDRLPSFEKTLSMDAAKGSIFFTSVMKSGYLYSIERKWESTPIEVTHSDKKWEGRKRYAAIQKPNSKLNL